MKSVKKMLIRAVVVSVAVSSVVGWFSASQSTRRYIIHIAKQVPYLPYRYFI